MIYLLWAFINIGLIILICFKGSKYLRQKFGPVAAVIFVLGLLSFVGRSNSDKNNKEQNSNQIKTWKFNSKDSLDKASNVFMVIDLEKTLISKYSLGISYGKDKQLQNNIPVSAITWISGFESGTSWKPISINVNCTDNNHKFDYEVDGTIKWSLLGITMYSQSKHWKGIADLK